jgi:hypothetical protein
MALSIYKARIEKDVFEGCFSDLFAQHFMIGYLNYAKYLNLLKDVFAKENLIICEFANSVFLGGDLISVFFSLLPVKLKRPSIRQR